MSNRDDDNRNNKKYVNSHLCFLEANTFKRLPNNIKARHTYIVLDFYLFAAYTFYINMGNRNDRLPVWLTTYLSKSFHYYL